MPPTVLGSCSALPAWQASHAYLLGDQIQDANGNVQQVTTPGTSGGTQPTWNAATSGTTADNAPLVWTNQGPATLPTCESWAGVFCICHGAFGTPPDPNPGGCFGNAPAGTKGVYSTAATTATQIDATGLSGLGVAWSNINNAKTEDGSYASVVIPDGDASLDLSTGQYGVTPTKFIVLKGFDFACIPNDATLVAIGLAVKGHTTGIGGNGPGGKCDLCGGLHTVAMVWNLLLTLAGTPYYYADPSSDVAHNAAHSAPYVLSQPESDAFAGICTDASGDADGCECSVDSITAYDAPGCVAASSVTWCRALRPASSERVNTGPVWQGNGLEDFTPTKSDWTIANIKDSTFGVGLSLCPQSDLGQPSVPGCTAFLDCFGVVIYYTGGTPPDCMGGGGVITAAFATTDPLQAAQVSGGSLPAGGLVIGHALNCNDYPNTAVFGTSNFAPGHGILITQN